MLLMTKDSVSTAVNSMRGVAGVYAITSKSTGKIYVGSSKNIGRRLTVHELDLRFNRHHSVHMQRHYNRHGADDLVFETLETENDPTLRLGLETLLIRALYGTGCFNHARDASAPTLGRALSSEHRAKLSAALKGKPKSPEAIAKRRETRSDPEVAARISGRISASLTGKKLSASHIAALSASHIGKNTAPRTDATRAKISAAIKGKHLSPETIAKRTASRALNRARRGL